MNYRNKTCNIASPGVNEGCFSLINVISELAFFKISLKNKKIEIKK